MVKPYLVNYISVWIASSLVTLFVFQGGPALPWFHRLSGFRDDGLDALGRGILDVTRLKGNGQFFSCLSSSSPTNLGLTDRRDHLTAFSLDNLTVPSTATELSDSAYRRPELLARLSSCQIQDDPDHPLTRKYGRRNLDLMVPFKGSRDRLGWFMRKLKSGHPVKVVVVGGSSEDHLTSCSVWTLERTNSLLHGSVTHGHGVLVPGATYGERIFDWIKENYLNERHSYVNAAVPGASVVRPLLAGFVIHGSTESDTNGPDVFLVLLWRACTHRCRSRDR